VYGNVGEPDRIILRPNVDLSGSKFGLELGEEAKKAYRTFLSEREVTVPNKSIENLLEAEKSLLEEQESWIPIVGGYERLSKTTGLSDLEISKSINKKLELYPNYLEFDQSGIAKFSYGIGSRYVDKTGRLIGRKYVFNASNLYPPETRWKVEIFVSVAVCLGWLLALSVHEFGHAVVAYWGGDRSVKAKGYLTLNPLNYTHPFMSIVLPGIFLMFGNIELPGAAVYVDESQLRNRWWQSAVSAAGPIASFLLMILLTVPFWFGFAFSGPDWLVVALTFLIVLQFYVVLLNSLPIPPLDGYGVIEPWLPQKLQERIRNFPLVWLIGLFVAIMFVVPLILLLALPSMQIVQQMHVPIWMGLAASEFLNRWVFTSLVASLAVLKLSII
jgi:Zn-dependent protease